MPSSIDFSATLPLISGAFVDVPENEQWIIHERWLELEQEPPLGAALRLVRENVIVDRFVFLPEEIVSWQPLCAISVLRNEGMLQRRVERLEAALTHNLGLTPFGGLRRAITLSSGASFWPELRGCLLPVENIPQNTDLVLRGVLHVVGVKTMVT